MSSEGSKARAWPEPVLRSWYDGEGEMQTGDADEATSKALDSNEPSPDVL